MFESILLPKSRFVARNTRLVLGMSMPLKPSQVLKSNDEFTSPKFSSLCKQETSLCTRPIPTQIRCIATQTSPEPDATQSFIRTAINDNKVVIFSKTYCPFCSQTKKLFRTLGEDAKVFEMDTMADGAEIQNKLASMTGQRSVPNVFVNGTHVGGNDDTQLAAKSGKLDALLNG